ncbi:MAG: glycosyltransferase [Pseudomonadota bacterium]
MEQPHDTPLVSIVINNFNYGRYLGDAIASALAQTHPRTEVVVVDDGSTDCSRDVIAGHGDRVIAVLKENGGQGSAVNAGFAACSGAIVNFLDADDLLEADAAARAAAALAADPGLSQWMAPLWMVDADGRPKGGILPGHPLPHGELGRRLLAFGPWAHQVVPTSGNFWSRAYLERVLPMPAERFRIGADEYLYSLAGLHGRIASDPRPAARYRCHGANAYWRAAAGLDDVVFDAAAFERIAATLAEHAARLGLQADPEAWTGRDWRQQVRRVVLNRAGRRPDRPAADAVLGAVWRDQTRPTRKAILFPAVAVLLAAPPGLAVGLGLRLLGRR